jgi:hypothetical protein
VQLYKASDDIDAHLVGGRLAEAGVATHTVKDRAAPGAWLYGGTNPWAPVIIYVRKLQLDAARMVLAEIAWAAPTASEPESATSRPAVPALWWVTALALGLAMSWGILAQVGRAALP